VRQKRGGGSYSQRLIFTGAMFEEERRYGRGGGGPLSKESWRRCTSGREDTGQGGSQFSDYSRKIGSENSRVLSRGGKKNGTKKSSTRRKGSRTRSHVTNSLKSGPLKGRRAGRKKNTSEREGRPPLRHPENNPRVQKMEATACGGGRGEETSRATLTKAQAGYAGR